MLGKFIHKIWGNNVNILYLEKYCDSGTRMDRIPNTAVLEVVNICANFKRELITIAKMSVVKVGDCPVRAQRCELGDGICK